MLKQEAHRGLWVNIRGVPVSVEVEIHAPTDRVVTAMVRVGVGTKSKAVHTQYLVEGHGSAVKDRGDSPDASIGASLAVARAMRQAASRLRQQAWNTVRRRDENRKTEAERRSLKEATKADPKRPTESADTDVAT